MRRSPGVGVGVGLQAGVVAGGADALKLGGVAHSGPAPWAARRGCLGGSCAARASSSREGAASGGHRHCGAALRGLLRRLAGPGGVGLGGRHQLPEAGLGVGPVCQDGLALGGACGRRRGVWGRWRRPGVSRVGSRGGGSQRPEQAQQQAGGSCAAAAGTWTAAQRAGGRARTGALHVRLNQAAQLRLARARLQPLNGHDLGVDAVREVAWRAGGEGGGGGGAGREGVSSRLAAPLESHNAPQTHHTPQTHHRRAAHCSPASS